MRVISLLFLLVGFVASDQLAAYWGQDPAGGSHLNREKSISHYCDDFDYDIIQIAFLDIFFYPFNKDSYPSINLANHCNKTFDGYPGLLDCPKVGDAIKHCQSKGKTIILSLGGAAGSYSFSSSSKAVLFANTIWNLFLDGQSSFRPFGDVSLDGLDLDIEAGTTKYYADFIRAIRQLMATNPNKKYIITGAPQCPFPDVIMGPGTSGTVLKDIPQEFDYLFVQFYNNYCYLGDMKQFQTSITSWFSFAAKTKQDHGGKGPLIFIGLPAHPRASSGSRYYQTPEQVKAVYEEKGTSQDVDVKNQKIQDNENLGGIMLWDASFDMNNMITNRPYSSHIAEFLKTTTKTTRRRTTTTVVQKIFYYVEIPVVPTWFLSLFGILVLLTSLVVIVGTRRYKRSEVKKLSYCEQSDLLFDLNGNLEKAGLL